MSKIFCYSLNDSGFWFRIFGYGLVFIDRRQHLPLFSVRKGYVKEWRVFGYGIQILRGWK